MNNNANIGEFIRDKRVAANMSQRQLGLYSKVSNTEISRIENGERQNPDPEILKKIAPFLGVTYEELMVVAGYIENINIVAEDKESYRPDIRAIARAAEKLSNDDVALIRTIIEKMKPNAFKDEDTE